MVPVNVNDRLYEAFTLDEEGNVALRLKIIAGGVGELPPNLQDRMYQMFSLDGEGNVAVNAIITEGAGAPTDATYLTVTDETGDLPESRQLVAGENVTFDDTTPGQLIVNADAGGGEAPEGAVVNDAETTESETYTDLTTPGPSATVVVGASGSVLVSIGTRMTNDTNNEACWMSFESSEVVASDDRAVSGLFQNAAEAIQAGNTFLLTGLTPGEQTFTAKYRVSDGVGTFSSRTLTVIPDFGQQGASGGADISENVLPKGDGAGGFIDSTLIDDGSVLTSTATVVSLGGNTHTSFPGSGLFAGNVTDAVASYTGGRGVFALGDGISLDLAGGDVWALGKNLDVFGLGLTVFNIGSGNNIGATDVNTSFAWVIGESNELHGQTDAVFIFGYDNAMELADNATTEESGLVGTQNRLFDRNRKVWQFGVSNEVTGVVGGNGNVIVGVSNILNGHETAGSFFAFGDANTIDSEDSQQMVIGFGVDGQGAGTIGIGVSSTPEVVLSSGTIVLNGDITLVGLPVTFGDNDSGGSGFRALVVPNTV